MREYFQKHKLSLIVLAAALCLILVSSFIASAIQSAGFSVTVTDLQNVTNTGVLAGTEGADKPTAVAGKVASGILFMPKDASASNKRAAVVLTHGYLNNRELQLQNAIELARRGFIVLTIDRGGHGNNEITTAANAMMNTDGLYDSAKYLYNLPEVDQSRIGISGHSMGGYTTAATLAADAQVGIISAGLMQGWSSFMGAGANVSVGNLKARDDEFFYTSGSKAAGTFTPSRQYLSIAAAATFVGTTFDASTPIKNGGIYVGGVLQNVAGGAKANGVFRVVYEANEIHPLNHFSTESAGYVTNFFYTAFGTQGNIGYIAENNQTWWVKEAFSFLGLIGFFAMLLPLVRLLLTVPFFASLRKKESEEGEVLPELKGVRGHISYWLVGVLTTLFSGFAIYWMQQSDNWLSKFSNLVTQNTYFPQDQTGKVASWAIVCIAFAALLSLVVYIINLILDKVLNKDEQLYRQSPFAAGKFEGGFGGFVKTIVLAFVTVVAMYAVVFATWAIFKVDFRIWTLDVKTFEISVMGPAMLRYAAVFAIYYVGSSILNQTYRVKNLPEWATIAINAAFNVIGIMIVMFIQYGTIAATGETWDSPLFYIVLFPIIPILVIATIYSRKLYKETGNAWLGGLVNALLFTVISVANTAASFPFAGLFA